MLGIKKELVTYEGWHLEALMGYLRPLEQGVYEKINKDYRAWHKMIMADTPEPVTILVDGKPVLVGGVSMLWEGVGESWIIGSQYFRENYIFITKQAIKYMNYIIRKYKLRRLQAITKAGNPELAKYAQFLNFKYEGELRGYGMDGSNQYMFSRVA